ncbi:YSIRK-type signal peptide-containing protein [Streptococcus shenyangsis]|uniref:Thiol-activated cytolysin n=1 Tax=Streptococcus shenyangsis TaxID=2589786 RepID=A0ABY2YBW1_9STRE|nr:MULTISPECIES: thiol-activated cytolysin family protein [Streptococcus]EGU70678.1 thiol-activated cytolysin [Streptococcus mitis SK569]TPE36877.1 YSIRK-type signal peptide-containing protein [Streptococcus sp. D2]TPE37014.1 YSIRK-type signal peptide-containing protein [Streptococcus shenyangsis]
MFQNKQDKGFRYSIRKRSVGVCGVAVATFLLASGLVFQTNVVKATEPSVAAVAGENIAAHKSASQSSIAYGGDASRAVDGNRDNAWSHRSVTHTDFQDHSWWKVDLEKEESVGTVRIYNRGDGDVANRLSNFDVILLDKDGNEAARQHVDSLNNQPTVDVQFSGVDARYVKIELNKSKTPLSLAEVEVYRSAKSEKIVENKKTENKSKTDFTAELNKYLFGLNYDKTNILTRRGEAIENYTNTSTKQQGNEFVVVEKVKKNLSSGHADVAINGNGDIFLGALFKANQDLLENKPQQISLDRSKGRISVDLPGMVGGDSYVDATPTVSGMQEGVNTLLNRWHEKYAGKNPAPARMQYESTSAYSMNQLKAKFGSDFEKVGVNLKIDFEAVNKGEKQIEVVDFKQVYYTANFDAPKNPSDVFASGVTVDQLKARGIDENTPPVYVSSVSYGRQMYVKFETTSKSTELKAAINAVIKGVPIKAESEWARVLKNTTVTVSIVGGNADGAARVVTGTVEDLKKLIQEGATFSTQNPAVPISYKTAFLKDNQVATIQSNTDYIETKVTSYKNGYLNLHHKGAYIARYYVYWDEVTYDKDGVESIRSRQWEHNGQNRTAGFQTELQFKGNVRNLRVKIQEKTGLAWEPWRTVYNRTDLPLVQKRTIINSGTTIRPKYDEKVENN